LLVLFRDYVEPLGASLTPAQQHTINQACANVLQAYPTHHDNQHVAGSGEESLLILLDLLLKLAISDGCFSEASFFGLQQVLPLMSLEVLHRPAVSSKFFSLITLCMEKYAEQMNNISFELLNSILQCILFGMTVSSVVAKDCLDALTALAMQHLRSNSLQNHLSSHPDLFIPCIRELLKVIFQQDQVVLDRIESAAAAILVLAAVDIPRFATIVNELAASASPEQQQRLHTAFTNLFKEEVVANASKEGYEGRICRENFKEEFEGFVNNVRSFMVVM
jgi:hypothetical protein